MLFDNLFAWVGPFGSALALLALVVACFAVAATETARVAQLDRVAARHARRVRRRALVWRSKVAASVAEPRRRALAWRSKARLIGR